MIGCIPILDISPVVDCGTRPAKAVVGEMFEVSATIFFEGPDALSANVGLYDADRQPRPQIQMREVAPGTDLWSANVTFPTEGHWTYIIEAWSDPVATWRRTAKIKIPEGIETELVLDEGAALYDRAAECMLDQDSRNIVFAAANTLRNSSSPAASRLAAATAPAVDVALSRHPLRELITASRPLPVIVERRRALYSSWYEMFPRSEGARVELVDKNSKERRPSTRVISGSFRSAADRLPAVADMGFDVVYLPPIHPIGMTHRKGKNNSLSASARDPGVPWAIGSADGGHDTVHLELETLDDFDYFVQTARTLGMEVALDFALQCSPDHPWVTEHPDWFHRRSDSSVVCAENSPKKYEDIYPLAFDKDFNGIVSKSVRILRFWMGHGVRIFRVDNHPHTKPVMFWEEVLGLINRTDPDVIFLAEAFTRPAMMRTLAAVGFQQSCTYFTWRNTKHELTQYVTELAGKSASYMRPDFFVNTPDILSDYLQRGGRPAFEARAILATTLSPSWGLYAGFELCENTPTSPRSEEYLDSEKYEIKIRDWDSAEREGRSLAPLITLLNRIRRQHPALQQLRDTHFHSVDNESLIVYSKRAGSDVILVIVNLDPFHAQEATVSLDTAWLGTESVSVRDELTGETYQWGKTLYVRLEPALRPAHIAVLLLSDAEAEQVECRGRGDLTCAKPLISQPSRTDRMSRRAKREPIRLTRGPWL